jgi:predicted CoA-binding protein
MATTPTHHSEPAQSSWQHDRRLSHRGLPSEDTITRLLQSCRTLAVVGLSAKMSRPSYGVAAYMQSRGYRVIPVNPHENAVLGERAYPDLASVPEPIDVVVIFRKPRHMPEIVENAIRRNARVIWMQEGLSHDQAAARARSAGLEVVQDRCILKEHARRFLSEGI